MTIPKEIEEIEGKGKENISQEFLDQNRSRKTIAKLKRNDILFGKKFVAIGGKRTTEEFMDLLQIGQGAKVLDIGCGCGGSAFYIAENCHAKVLGVDHSEDMICQGKKYLKDLDDVVKENVEFRIGNITKMDFEENSFDCIYSREVMLHIQDKEILLSKFLRWLKPGGRMLISEYCYGPTIPKSREFLNYIKKRNYHLRTVGELGEVLHKVGFQNIQAEDRTNECTEIIQKDLDHLLRDKHEIHNSITRCEYDDIVTSWELKLQQCKLGDEAWGLFIGTK